jgi:hypothetical protein
MRRRPHLQGAHLLVVHYQAHATYFQVSPTFEGMQKKKKALFFNRMIAYCTLAGVAEEHTGGSPRLYRPGEGHEAHH